MYVGIVFQEHQGIIRSFGMRNVMYCSHFFWITAIKVCNNSRRVFRIGVPWAFMIVVLSGVLRKPLADVVKFGSAPALRSKRIHSVVVWAAARWSVVLPLGSIELGLVLLATRIRLFSSSTLVTAQLSAVRSCWSTSHIAHRVSCFPTWMFALPNPMYQMSRAAFALARLRSAHPVSTSYQKPSTFDKRLEKTHFT